MAGKMMVVGGAAGALAAVALGFGLTLHQGGEKALVGDNFAALRREALARFPRGTPVTQVRGALEILGFACAATRRLLPNINAPSLECDSAGRGYPTSSRIEVTVMARNGVVSDIAFGDGQGHFADAQRPDPDSEQAQP